jgi:hypothetical protein
MFDMALLPASILPGVTDSAVLGGSAVPWTAPDGDAPQHGCSERAHFRTDIANIEPFTTW